MGFFKTLGRLANPLTPFKAGARAVKNVAKGNVKGALREATAGVGGLSGAPPKRPSAPRPPRPTPGPPNFGAVDGLPGPARQGMGQSPIQGMDPNTIQQAPGGVAPGQLSGAIQGMPGPAPMPPPEMPQTGGPDPSSGMMKPQQGFPGVPSMPGQYGGINPQQGMPRPGGNVFGNPWGGFGG